MHESKYIGSVRCRTNTALFVLVCCLSLSASAETVRIRVEDGRNGKPIANERLNVWVNATAGRARVVPVGKDGVAVLQVPPGSSIDVASNLYVDCRPFRKDARDLTYAVDEINADGIVAENTCGKRRPQPRPGELILFVRPRRFWEEMRL